MCVENGIRTQLSLFGAICTFRDTSNTERAAAALYSIAETPSLATKYRRHLIYSEVTEVCNNSASLQRSTATGHR